MDSKDTILSTEGERLEMPQPDNEPKLKYQRLGASVGEVLKEDSASAMAVSERFVVLGTHNGSVLLLDFQGDVVNRFTKHTASVSDISIDANGEYVASASLDGKVAIYGLYPESSASNDSKEVYPVEVYDYKRPVKCVALDPEYNRKKTRPFVCGGMAGILHLREKGWFGDKDTPLQGSGEGPITAVKWRGSLIAWANDEGVKMYDTNSQNRITWIARPSDSPRADLYRCNLCWRSDTTLMIGWADSIRVAIVRDTPRQEILQGKPPLYAEIIAQITTDFIVCGIAPFRDMMLLLAYPTADIHQHEETDDPEKQKRQKARPPELRIIDSANEEISCDALRLHGFQHYQPNDYVLDYLSSEDMFYVVSPKDLVVARERDLDDHIKWLKERSRYEEALQSLREALIRNVASAYTIKGLGQKYLEYLVGKEEFDKAAAECPNILGDDAELWERWIYAFADMWQLQSITPFIPYKNPQLSDAVYEMVLLHFLQNDHQSLVKTIMNWPSTLYNIRSVIVLVEEALIKENDNPILMECLAELYAYNREPDKALEYNLRLRRPNVFELIRDYNLFSALEGRIILLMEFDQHLMKEEEEREKKEKQSESADGDTAQKNSTKSRAKRQSEGPAVQLLVQNTELVPTFLVVRELKENPYFMYIYLDALFHHDPHLGYEYHDMQIELYAEYEYDGLMEFLRTSNYYSLDRAYEICKQRDLVPEMVFILGRMGNNKQALMLIIERLQDVQRAIDFAKEQDNEILWEDLLVYSLDKPRFIIGLLENLGSTNIDPIAMIRRIPGGLEIPGLKQALIKVLQDYNLQASLREGCEKILVNDSVAMVYQLNQAQKHGISCEAELNCSICQETIIRDDLNSTPDPKATTIIFFCKHAYHQQCLLDSESFELSNQPLKPAGGRFGIAPKIRHTTLLRSLGRPPQCPICHEAQHKHKPLSKGKRATGPIKGFVRSRQGSSSSSSLKDDDGMPPMVPLRF
ncbi:7650_t:CDS:10 [Paraglomus occultum]|uniref:Vacuolar protein sorting-associated protein 41 n=1 Tax=Paraglomus occultum TaxID=144539 RepID=A0A9N8VMF5_9GLOM|nr:7650_t:CDS:10 [Paraglomus occultum]